MAPICTHLDAIHDVVPSGYGCEECLALGQEWLHLRLCMTCGHVGCCDQSPGRHSTQHYDASKHPIIKSFEPDEDWLYCYPDDLMFEVEGVPAMHHP